MGVCFKCQSQLPQDKIFFSDDCLSCGLSIHVCKNCIFYDESSSNFCREPAAERVIEKEKKNFCEFFEANQSAAKTVIGKEEMLSAAEALFKKK